MALLDEIPAEARALADMFAIACGIDRGRVTLIIAEGRVVDGFAERRFGPRELERLPVGSFCSCTINTSTVHGLCIVCKRPKSDEQPAGPA